MAMVLTQFPEEYDADITTRVMDGIGNAPAEWRMYFNVETDKRAVIKLTNYSGFGQVPQWYDGEALPLDEALSIGDQTLTMLFYGLGFVVTRKHVDYGELRIINGWADSLARSVAQTYGVTHANVLNNAFTTTYSHFGSKTLCSTTHTTSGAGTRSNRLSTDAALTPANAETLYVQGLNWVNYRGLNDPFYANRIIVPPALRRQAVKITQSEGEPSTTDNDINTQRGLWSIVVDPHLTSSTAWWLQAPGHGLQSIHGMTPTPINYTVDGERSLIHGSEFDFVTGVAYPDGVLGTSGA
jgi:hypothetical protein